MRFAAPIAVMVLALVACDGGGKGAAKGERAPWSPQSLARMLNPGDYHKSHELEPYTYPNAYFVRDPATGVWCGITDMVEAEAYRTKFQPQAKDGVQPDAEWGWIRLDQGRLQSITLSRQTKIASVEDRYLFQEGALTAMKRTGHDLKSPWATFTFTPGPDGKLALEPASRQIRAELEGKGQSAAIVDWPTYAGLSDLPVHGLLVFEAAKVSVRATCPKASEVTTPPAAG